MLRRAAIAAVATVFCGPGLAATPAGWVDMIHGKTDAIVYEEGSVRADLSLGDAFLINGMEQPLWLHGCYHYAIEQQRPDSGWIDQGSQVDCEWEGFALRIDAGATMSFRFFSGGIGTFRIRFDVNFGCIDGKPMSQAECTDEGQVWTPPFIVQ